MAADHVVAAFSADQIAKLAGLTMRQLAYWDRRGFFKPQYASENRRSPFSRIYSFSDLVGLRTVSVLMKEFHVSLRHLQEVAAKLATKTERPWSELRLTVWNGEVAWLEPGAEVPTGVLTGQMALFRFVDVIDDMGRAAIGLRTRSSDEFGVIVRRRNVAHNRAVFSGTRIPVGAVQRFAKAGYSREQILKEYPSLTPDDIASALREMKSQSAA